MGKSKDLGDPGLTLNILGMLWVSDGSGEIVGDYKFPKGINLRFGDVRA